jgi:hypothetical protein
MKIRPVGTEYFMHSEGNYEEARSRFLAVLGKNQENPPVFRKMYIFAFRLRGMMGYTP